MLLVAAILIVLGFIIAFVNIGTMINSDRSGESLIAIHLLAGLLVVSGVVIGAYLLISALLNFLNN